MAGLVPAIHVLVVSKKKNVDARVKPGNDTSCQNMNHYNSTRRKTWMPGTQASEATSFFERLCPGMTQGESVR